MAKKKSLSSVAARQVQPIKRGRGRPRMNFQESPPALSPVKLKTKVEDTGTQFGPPELSPVKPRNKLAGASGRGRSLKHSTASVQVSFSKQACPVDVDSGAGDVDSVYANCRITRLRARSLASRPSNNRGDDIKGCGTDHSFMTDSDDIDTKIKITPLTLKQNFMSDTKPIFPNVISFSTAPTIAHASAVPLPAPPLAIQRTLRSMKIEEKCEIEDGLKPEGHSEIHKTTKSEVKVTPETEFLPGSNSKPPLTLYVGSRKEELCGNDHKQVDRRKCETLTSSDGCEPLQLQSDFHLPRQTQTADDTECCQNMPMNVSEESDNIISLDPQIPYSDQMEDYAEVRLSELSKDKNHSVLEGTKSRESANTERSTVVNSSILEVSDKILAKNEETVDSHIGGNARLDIIVANEIHVSNINIGNNVLDRDVQSQNTQREHEIESPSESIAYTYVDSKPSSPIMYFNQSPRNVNSSCSITECDTTAEDEPIIVPNTDVCYSAEPILVCFDKKEPEKCLTASHESPTCEITKQEMLQNAVKQDSFGHHAFMLPNNKSETSDSLPYFEPVDFYTTQFNTEHCFDDFGALDLSLKQLETHPDETNDSGICSFSENTSAIINTGLEQKESFIRDEESPCKPMKEEPLNSLSIPEAIKAISRIDSSRGGDDMKDKPFTNEEIDIVKVPEHMYKEDVQIAEPDVVTSTCDVKCTNVHTSLGQLLEVLDPPASLTPTSTEVKHNIQSDKFKQNSFDIKSVASTNNLNTGLVESSSRHFITINTSDVYNRHEGNPSMYKMIVGGNARFPSVIFNRPDSTGNDNASDESPFKGSLCVHENLLMNTTKFAGKNVLNQSVNVLRRASEDGGDVNEEKGYSNNMNQHDPVACFVTRSQETESSLINTGAHSNYKTECYYPGSNLVSKDIKNLEDHINGGDRQQNDVNQIYNRDSVPFSREMKSGCEVLTVKVDQTNDDGQLCVPVCNVPNSTTYHPVKKELAIPVPSPVQSDSLELVVNSKAPCLTPVHFENSPTKMKRHVTFHPSVDQYPTERSEHLKAQTTRLTTHSELGLASNAVPIITPVTVCNTLEQGKQPYQTGAYQLSPHPPVLMCAGMHRLEVVLLCMTIHDYWEFAWTCLTKKFKICLSSNSVAVKGYHYIPTQTTAAGASSIATCYKLFKL